jgi:colicin import membrane protein
MAEQKESSVLFSLKELMSLEEDRIRQEDDERKRKEQAELQARLDTERRAREAEEARMNADEERRRQDEQRTREEHARIDAIRQGEVEKARHDAEAQARLRAMQQTQEHERQLTVLKQDKKKKQLTFVVIGIAALMILGAGGGGYAFWASAKEQARIQAFKDKEIAEQKQQLDTLMSQLKAQNDAVAQAQAEAASAHSDADRAAAQAKLAEAQRQASALQGRIGTLQRNPVGPTPPRTTPRAACTCLAGDPLCSCIP